MEISGRRMTYWKPEQKKNTSWTPVGQSTDKKLHYALHEFISFVVVVVVLFFNMQMWLSMLNAKNIFILDRHVRLTLWK